MTHRYLVSSDGQGGVEPLGSVPYTSIVPPGWQGYCCHCRRRLTVADWQVGQVVAAGTGNPWHCICLAHLQTRGPEYNDALVALACAVAGK
jgi:hypothetical protein